MPRPRFKNLEKEKKQLILDVASCEFAEHGFQNASYNTIIEKCGLSKGVMYYYFDDKRDLFDTILNEANECYLDFIGNWQKVDSKQKFWKQIKELFFKSVAFFEEDPRAARLVAMSLKSSDVLSETYRQLEQSSSAWFIEVLSEGQNLRAVRNDLPMDYLVMLVFGVGQASDQWMLSRWQTSSREEIMQDTELVFNVFKQLLSPQK